MKKMVNKYWNFIVDNKTTLLFLIVEILYLIAIELYNQYLIERNSNILILITESNLRFNVIWILMILIIIILLKPIVRKY